MRCVFRDCSEPVLPDSHKCAFHKNRRLCSVIGCENQVYARKLCVKHGARKRCSFPKCHAFTQGYAACPDHHVWRSPKASSSPASLPYSPSSVSAYYNHAPMMASTPYALELCKESLDAAVFACTPQWIDAIDLAWLEAI
ncbi:hypothetical protein SPRG_07830 [Saprolegnia parasitica CBS 223.65]|uniref:Uncharacterized protein n=1 Tax=Saprolegnia parasitica (strain CBS 223.65) TaxID=695850 RepID=A0A067C8N1_SAPPC|nr:hypothetical protein SPRG_07830 [Saprolegnia parasitica CBS 223.65]KDO27119.1 hypothetical protein SPRG_07830 [Saprolegnia parasitica CBS 223.65]|eukprot:XP_012202212.1 hypothetical protein SPRG_07830 [Saprolegnia parasitica CBS 223.65]